MIKQVRRGLNNLTPDFKKINDFKDIQTPNTNATIIPQKSLQKSQHSIMAKRWLTLPKKTQPTSYSSGKISNKYSNSKIQYNQVQTCPQVQSTQVQVSPFEHQTISKLKSKSKKELHHIYTHKLRLDYGRLQKPTYYGLQKEITKQLQLSNELSSFIQTKQFKNFRFQNDQFQQNKNRNLVNQPKTDKKMKPIQIKSIQLVNPESQMKNEAKNKILKINVRAYDYLNKTLQIKEGEQKRNQAIMSNGFKSDKKQKDGIKNSKKTNPNDSQIKNKGNNQNLLTNSRISNKSSRNQTQNQDSQRKILHSRIVRMVNPSSGMQTKIISYPDLSDLKRLKKIL